MVSSRVKPKSMLVVMICRVRDSLTRFPSRPDDSRDFELAHLILTMRTVEHACISFVQMRPAMQSLK